MESYGHKRSQVGGESHAPNNTGNGSQGVQTSSNSQRSSAFTSSKRNIVCHGCGEQGHIRPNCPHKIKTVSSPTLDRCSSKSKAFVGDSINSTFCSNILVDSGCELTYVAKSLVDPSSYTHFYIPTKSLIKVNVFP